MLKSLLAITVAAGVLSPSTVRAQSLFVDRGQNAAEGTVGWSFGPSSDGLETRFGGAIDGRFDVGVGINRYTFDFDDGSSSTFSEIAPYVKWFATKESDGAPVSLSLDARYFADNFEGDDSGWYVMLGPTVYKQLTLSPAVTLYPFLGFAFVGESYTFGGGDPDRAAYLARMLGVIFTTRLGGDDRSLLRFEVEEQSFRRETYRAARVGYVRRF